MKNYAFSILCLIPLFVNSQTNHTISGYVYDASSLEPLVGAHVITDKEKGHFTVSNVNGYYSVKTTSFKDSLLFSYVGYDPFYTAISYLADTVLNIYLHPSTLKEVIVHSNRHSVLNINNRSNLSIRTIKSQPSLAGEVDLMKTLTLLPGISPGLEGSTGINIRGGSPDQNLILLDDAPVYNVAHLYGFVSVFNADAIKNVEVLKGDFPARYGGRLSSVINVTMKEGNKKEFHGEVTSGIISSKLTLEIPLKKDRTSLMISGRTAYPDLITIPQRIGYHNGQKDELISYSMWDGNVKLHHFLGKNGSLSVSHYSGRDNYIDNYRESDYQTQENSRHWGNITNTIRYNQILSRKLFVEAIAYHTYYHYEDSKENRLLTDAKTQHLMINTRSSLQDVGGKVLLNYSWSNSHQLSGGLHLINHTYNPSINSLKNEYDGASEDINLSKKISTSGNEMALFLEDGWQISKKLKSTFGLRHSAIFIEGKSFSGIEPRTSLTYEAAPKTNVDVSFSYMRQYIHLLTSSTVSLSNDIWVPVTSLAPPQNSFITTAGLNTQMFSGYSSSVEVFYKKMNNLIDHQEGVSPTTGFNENWDQLIESGGEGEAYGLELLVQKNVGRLTGWLSYTLSWNNRQFENINEGRKYPYRYDRRHNIALVGNYKLNERYSFSSNWIFMPGYAVTAPVALYFTHQDVFAYGERNNARMPAYHRLDLSMHKTRITKKGNQSTWSLGVYNTYLRKNPLFLETSVSGYTSAPQRGFQIYASIRGPAYFIFIPSVSYSFKF